MSTQTKLSTLPIARRPAPEALVEKVEFFRLDASRRLSPENQADLGQFMTPAPVAQIMASMFEGYGASLRLLDAGAGVGSLSAALVAELCSRPHPPSDICLSTFEIDSPLVEYLRQTLDACRVHCADSGLHFRGEVRQEDFVAAGTDALRGTLFAPSIEPFDGVILNPPYRKISSDSRMRKQLEALGLETTNLYTAFLAIAIRLLKPGGELVAITPRSFCNGPYFRSFRVQFLDAMALRRIHCFEARDRAFSEDDVLQENVIVHAVKAKKGTPIVLSCGLGPDDDCPTWREISPDHVVKPNDPDRFIHIPTDALSEAVALRMEQFHCSLHDLGLEVSTGRVVDFRAEPFLRQDPAPGTVPLIYPGHMVGGYVQWPKSGSKKPNALVLTTQTERLLVPKGFYVVTKRFSSKEEKRRIVAAVYDPSRLPDSDVAFENHLNHFHARGLPVSHEIARGLAAFLNSSLVDSFFRNWSGHTQVNASDLRRLRYPTRAQLEALGAHITGSFPDQEELDRRIEEDLVDMPKHSPDPIRAKNRLQEALAILKDLGLPRQQQNDRSALVLLALLDMKPTMPWSKASDPLRGITELMKFFAEHYGKTYAPNTRETVRRQTVHQFVDAGLAVINPDKPARPTNSGDTVYQIEPRALELVRAYKSKQWREELDGFLASAGTLSRRYALEREMQRIPLKLRSGARLSLSPGGHNELVVKIVREFCERFTPGAIPIYIGDTADKWAHFDETALRALGVKVDVHGKMPDVVVHYKAKRWLVLVEAVTSHGPMNPKRRQELKRLFKNAKAGLVFVTAFLTRRDLTRHLADIAWETEVWAADFPSHLIHFDGERFLGPFEG